MQRLALLILLLGGCLASFSRTTLADEIPPNIIIILMDDMGYSDINPFGGSYSTPNLDRMAKEGRQFTDFVVSSAVCSASRAALLTGTYHTRIGISGALMPKSRIGLNSDEVTIAELCQSKGYDTAMFGKWHLGHHPKFLPTNHGFDQFYGIPYSNDMWPFHPAAVAKRQRDPNAKINWPALPMIKADHKKGVRVLIEDMQPEDQAVMTKEFTERATDFIKQHPDTPFFLYLAHPMVHVPLFASDEFLGKSGMGLFGDVVMEVDWSVGQILGAVEDIGVERNTLVVFTSDNGPWLSYGRHAGTAGPFREGKGTMFEGGYREPTLMWWKGKIPADTSCNDLCSTIDLLPTIAKLIGAELPKNRIDGHDIAPLVFAEEDAKSPHDAFYCYYGGGQLQAVRDDRFKLVFPHRYRTLNGHPGGMGGLSVPYQHKQAKRALYDLENDPGETKDVTEEFPDVVQRLEKAAEEAREDLGDKLTGSAGKNIRPPGKMEPGDEELPLLWR